MKHFLRELKSEWESLKWSRYSSYTIKYQLKELLKSVNREVVALLVQLRSNLLFCFATILIATLTLSVIILLPHDSLVEALSLLSVVVFGLLTIFITAAIFMATISNQVLAKISDAMANYLVLLHSTSKIFKIVYANLPPDTAVDVRYRLLCAVEAECVLDQISYRQFRDWVADVKKDFKGTDYEETVDFPFDIIQQNVGGKSWALKDGLDILEHELKKTDEIKKIIKDNDKTISILRSGCVDYQVSGAASIYEQKDFLGTFLSRVLAYGLFAILISYLYRLFSGLTYDLFTGVELYSKQIIGFVVLFIMFSALTYAVKFLFHLAAYFRRVSSHYGDSSLSIYPEAESESRYYYDNMPGCGGMGSGL